MSQKAPEKHFIVVQWPTLYDPMDCSTPGFLILHYSQEFTQTYVLWIDDAIQPSHLIFCHPLLLLSVFPTIRILSNELTLRIRWPEYWSFTFSISPFNEYSGLISFTIDWFDLLAVQGTLKSLLQNHNLKASVLCSQPSLWSNSHIHTWQLEKPALTRWTFVSKVMFCFLIHCLGFS